MSVLPLYKVVFKLSSLFFKVSFRITVPVIFVENNLNRKRHQVNVIKSEFKDKYEQNTKDRAC